MPFFTHARQPGTGLNVSSADCQCGGGTPDDAGAGVLAAAIEAVLAGGKPRADVDRATVEALTRKVQAEIARQIGEADPEADPAMAAHTRSGGMPQRGVLDLPATHARADTGPLVPKGVLQ